MSVARRAKGLSLDGLPTKSLDARLVRCAPQLSFDAGKPPSYFFASDSGVAKALSIRDADLSGTWRGPRETKLQKLGRTVSEQRRISGVRFPSAASHAEGAIGWNVAIFIAALSKEDQVEILGRDLRPLEILTSTQRRRG